MQDLINQITRLAVPHKDKPRMALNSISERMHGLGLCIDDAEAVVDSVFTLSRALEEKQITLDFLIEREGKGARSLLPSDIEAVEIEWITNGILVRGKGSKGPFCCYYRDTSTFVGQHLDGETLEFVKGKKPKTGDKCIVYFGISDTDSSE